MKSIGVGVIGASPIRPGWAIAAHIPAIKSIQDFQLAAVSTSSKDSADAAAAAFNVPAYDDYRKVIAHPGVDLVVISVKVRHHREMALAALAGGKMAFCEWPLGRNLAEAREIADVAAASGLRTAIGLQGRFSPAIRQARKLVEEGYVGTVLATTLVGSGMAWGGETDRSRAYLFDRDQGASTLTVPTLHALDALNFVLGDFIEVGARLGTGRQTVRVKDDGSELAVSAPDQVAITARLERGAIASVFYRGGVSRGNNLYWEINGTEGDLVITSSTGNVQVAELSLQGGRGGDVRTSEILFQPDPIDVPEFPGGATLRLYEQLASDVRNGTHLTPDFGRALFQHQAIEAIERASETGHVQAIPRAPDSFRRNASRRDEK